MDGVDCKYRATVALFLVPGISPIIFMVEKCVHFDMCNKNNLSLSISKGLAYDLADFTNLDLAENLKNEPNHRRDSLKNFLFQI